MPVSSCAGVFRSWNQAEEPDTVLQRAGASSRWGQGQGWVLLCSSSAESVYPTLGSFRSWSVTILGAPPFQLFLFLVPAQVLGERMVGVCLCVSGVQATATAWRRTDFLSSPCHRPVPPTQPWVICWAKQQPCAGSHRAFEFVEQIQVEANLKPEVQAPPLQCPTQK